MPQRIAITWTLMSALAGLGSAAAALAPHDSVWIMTLWIVSTLALVCSTAFGCYWIRENHGEDTD